MSDPVKSEMSSPTSVRRVLNLEIPRETVEAETERIVRRYAATVKLAGFRKGKAPAEMVRSMFRDDIRKDVVDELVPRVVHDELEARHLHPVDAPEMEDLDFTDSGPLRCRIAFEVMPEFELPDLGRIKVPLKPASAGDAEVDHALEDLRARAAEYIPVTGRGVEADDYVVVRLQGTDLRLKKRLPAEQAVVLAGHPENEKELDEHLRGAMAGETRTYEVAYPADYPRKRLAGKTIDYTLEVKEIKSRRLPDLDDDFARGLGDYAGLEDLRAKVKAQILESSRAAARNEAAAEVLREIAARAAVDLPDGMVEKEADAVLRRALRGRDASGLKEEALGQLREQAKAQARQSILNHLILEKIAVRQGFTVSDEELRAEVEALAAANNVPAAGLMASLEREDRLEEVRERLLFRKAIDFLTGAAIMEATA